MDHAEARDLLDVAAVEPGGLERLMAGEGAEAAALAEHLAGCPECTAEMDAIRRSVHVIRDVIRTSPPADLRKRTLAYVAAVGRPRSQPQGSAAAPSPSRAPASTSVWSLAPVRDWRPLAWAGSLAAAMVVSVVATAWMVGGRIDSQLADANAAITEQRSAIAGLAMVTDWTLRLSADAEAGRARLQPAVGETPTGTVLFSSDSQELVMVASGLTPPPAGREYRCWVELEGERQPIGRMYFAGDLAYWVGEVDELTKTEGLAFGVSLVDAATQNLTGDVVLRGET
jgi:hypothetical protein